MPALDRTAGTGTGTGRRRIELDKNDKDNEAPSEDFSSSDRYVVVSVTLTSGPYDDARKLEHALNEAARMNSATFKFSIPHPGGTGVFLVLEKDTKAMLTK